MTMNERHRDLITISLAMNALGSAMTFTGLPSYVAQMTGNLGHSSGLFLMEAVASLIVTFFAGAIADRYSRKWVAIVASISSGLAMIALAACLKTRLIWSFYVFGIIVSIFDSIAIVATNTWFNSFANKRATEEIIGRKNTILMAAKMIGMGCGPLLAAFVGWKIVLIDASSFFIAAFFLIFLRYPFQTRLSTTMSGRVLLKQGLAYIRQKPEFRGITTIAFCTGLLSSPLVNSAIEIIHLNYKGSPFLLSTLWLTGSIGSLITNFLISRGAFKRLGRYQSVIVANMIVICGLFIMTACHSPGVFIASFMLFTLSNPLINTYLSAAFLRVTPAEFMGRVTSHYYVVCDAGTILGITLATWAGSFMGTPANVLIFLPFILWRMRITGTILGPRMNGVTA